MKKIILILSLLLLFTKCNRNESKLNIDKKQKDSLSFYLLKATDTSINQANRSKYTKNAFSILSSLNNNKFNRQSLSKVVIISYDLKINDIFRKSSDLLLLNSIKVSDSISIANTYYNKAKFYFDNDVADSSFLCFLKAEKYFVKYNDTKKLADIYLKKATIQLSINNFFGAEYSASKSINYIKKNNDLLGLYDAYNILGIISNESANFEKALDYHNKALEIAKKSDISKNFFLYEITLNNIGNTYQNSNEYLKSIDYFNVALKNKNLRKKKPSLYATLIDNLAYSNFKSGIKKNLLQGFNESLKIRDSLKINSKIVYSKIHISEYLYSLGDSLKAKRIAYESLDLSKKENSSVDLLLVFKHLAAIDKVKSSSFSKQYIKLNDSLQLEERKNKDRFARIELETDELRQEKSVLEERNRNILSYLLGTIVIGGFLFFIRIQRSRQRELALKQSQQQANEEIYRLIISHQNQLEEGRDLEKKRISKELHDGVLGRLFGLRLNLEGLNNFDDTDAKQTRQEYLNELKVIEQDLREISHELNRENLVLINNFEAIINNHLDQQAKNYKPKLTAHLSDNINWEILPNTTKINLYRILQEALQNINKHAEAKHISVQFVKDAKGNLLFTIEDDGKGYNTNSKRSMGIGLSNIVERVHQCEGKIDIRSQLGKGTKIMITFPLENDTINM